MRNVEDKHSPTLVGQEPRRQDAAAGACLAAEKYKVGAQES